MLWAFFFLVLLESSVVHLLVGLWSPTSAWILFGVSAPALLYLLGLINSIRTLPILVADKGVLVRGGLLIEQFIPIDQVKDVTGSFDNNVIKSRHVLKATLMAHPNLLIELNTPRTVSKPFGRRLEITGIGIRPDDPVAFAEEVRQRKLGFKPV